MEQDTVQSLTTCRKLKPSIAMTPILPHTRNALTNSVTLYSSFSTITGGGFDKEFSLQLNLWSYLAKLKKREKRKMFGWLLNCPVHIHFRATHPWGFEWIRLWHVCARMHISLVPSGHPNVVYSFSRGCWLSGRKVCTPCLYSTFPLIPWGYQPQLEYRRSG